jgi:hypothetical protein
MATIALNQLTIPTPEPYSKNEPSKQLENVCYVLLQILIVGKVNGVIFTVNPPDLDTINAQLTALAEAFQ